MAWGVTVLAKCSDCAGIRTQDLAVKSRLLYRLSYAIGPVGGGGGRAREAGVDRGDGLREEGERVYEDPPLAAWGVFAGQ